MGKFRKIWEFKLPGGATYPMRAAPPEGEQKFLPMFKTELGPIYEYTLHSQRLVSFMVHHVDSRSVPCFRSAGVECEFCGPKTSRRWYGYLVGYSHRTKQLGIVTITQNCLKTAPALKKDQYDLVGRKLGLYRTHGHKRGQVIAKLDLVGRKEVPEAEIWSDHDLQAQLFWIWGIKVINEEKYDGD